MDEGMTWRWIPELCSNDYEMSDIWFICVKVRQFQERTNIVNIYNWFLIVRIQFFHVRFNTLQYHSIMRRECKKKKNVENDTILLKVKIHRFQVMDGILTVHRYISVIIYRGRKKKKRTRDYVDACKSDPHARKITIFQIRPIFQKNVEALFNIVIYSENE